MESEGFTTLGTVDRTSITKNSVHYVSVLPVNHLYQITVVHNLHYPLEIRGKFVSNIIIDDK